MTSDMTALEDLAALCRDGRLYDVEQWIQTGRPLQLSGRVTTRPRKWNSALRIAIKQQNHSLVFLLLCNGYDSDLEPESPLDLALETRQPDVVELLLTWGADPHRVDLEKVFESYSSGLFQRFYELGVDLAQRHAMAAALGFHTSNKPLYGFAKRHHKEDEKIQMELNMALVHHAVDGNEKGALLCLWAGANPHARAPSLRYWDPEDEDDEDDDGEPYGWSAVCGAAYRGSTVLLEKFRPDPSLDDIEQLYQLTTSPAVVDMLAPITLPSEMTKIVRHLLWYSSGWLRKDEALDTLERLFELGARWKEADYEDIKEIRRFLLDTKDRVFERFIRILAQADYCAPEILAELARTDAMHRRLRRLGYLRARKNDPDRHWGRRPVDADEIVKKLGIEMAKSKPLPRRLPRVVQIHANLPNGEQIRTDREGLLDLVWSKPVSQLASEWQMTGTGLASACRKIKVPVPPRGFWSKLAAGQRMTRPRLPTLPEGQVEEIVIGRSSEQRT